LLLYLPFSEEQNLLKKPAEEKMAAESKEMSTEKVTATTSDGTIEIITKILKKAAIVGAIYFVGYMNWSVAW
jgi:hypothetical protein